MALFYLLDKAERTFLEELEYEVKDLFRSFVDFFYMIKENTYDVLVSNFGAEVVNMTLLAVLFITLMIVATKIINK